MRSDGISLTNSPRDPISKVSSSPGRSRRLIYDDWKRRYDLRYWKQLRRKGPLIWHLFAPMHTVCSIVCSTMFHSAWSAHSPALLAHSAHLSAHSFTHLRVRLISLCPLLAPLAPMLIPTLAPMLALHAPLLRSSPHSTCSTCALCLLPSLVRLSDFIVQSWASDAKNLTILVIFDNFRQFLKIFENFWKLLTISLSS